LNALLPDLESLYKDVHAHPELSMQQTRTAGIAAERLRAAGYEVTSGVGGTGVVGLLRNGSGATVMLRADMAALPIAERTGVHCARARAPGWIPRAGALARMPRARRWRRGICAAPISTPPG